MFLPPLPLISHERLAARRGLVVEFVAVVLLVILVRIQFGEASGSTLITGSNHGVGTQRKPREPGAYALVKRLTITRRFLERRTW